MADCNRNCCNDCGRERKYPCDTNFREAVCVHTDKIYDSCRDTRLFKLEKMSIQN